MQLGGYRGFSTSTSRHGYFFVVVCWGGGRQEVVVSKQEMILSALTCYFYLRLPKTGREGLAASLSKTYDNGTKALDGLSLVVEEGQCLGYLGPDQGRSSTYLQPTRQRIPLNCLLQNYFFQCLPNNKAYFGQISIPCSKIFKMFLKLNIISPISSM